MSLRALLFRVSVHQRRNSNPQYLARVPDVTAGLAVRLCRSVARRAGLGCSAVALPSLRSGRDRNPLCR